MIWLPAGFTAPETWTHTSYFQSGRACLLTQEFSQTSLKKAQFRIEKAANGRETPVFPALRTCGQPLARLHFPGTAVYRAMHRGIFLFVYVHFFAMNPGNRYVPSTPASNPKVRHVP